MGLAASQARLLTITSRMHDIELKQQNISNQKMRLANESEEISNMYTRALNTQRYTFRDTATNSSRLMTLNTLLASGSKYKLQTSDGKTVKVGDGANTGSTYVKVSSKLANDPNWLYEAIESGEFHLVDVSGNPISTSSSTDIDTEYDKQASALAEAEYNAATSKINRKEKQLDQDARKLDTEYSAMTTEYESIKNIINQNSEKTFNLFS